MRLFTKQKDAKVWKVVRVDWKGRMLSFIDFLAPTWVVTYREGVWTYPVQKGSALYAFKSKNHARNFISGYCSSRYQIWRCTGDIVDGRLYPSWGGSPLISSGMTIWRVLKKFWLDPQNIRINTRAAPDGTVACRRIRLEKCVS